MAPTSHIERAWLLTTDRLHLTSTGAIDLLRLYDALKPDPSRLRTYVDISRRLRAERKAK